MSMQKKSNAIDHFDAIDLKKIRPGTQKNFWLPLVSDGLASPISIPVMIACGKRRKPVLGVTAALHGNELNGISAIQRLFQEIDPQEISGSIVGVPVVNIPSFRRKKRRFSDGVDLNHIMPGKKNGNVSQVYAYRFVRKVIKKVNFLLDLHTASSGRINSYYVRADLQNPKTRQLALLQNADIIVHNPPNDGTLRGAADALGIPAITLELGNPNIFQKNFIRSGVEGIHNVLSHLGIINDPIIPPDRETTICSHSYWIYTDRGGLLTVYPELKEKINKGAKIATLRNVFGEVTKEYYAPEEGIIIGKSTNPVNKSGGRILHLGILQ